MPKKRLLLCVSLLALTLALLCTGCAKTPRKEDLFGKVFFYEKEGFGSEFFITIHNDGSFTYYEGALSSHIGSGFWTLEEDILTLTDTVIPDRSRVLCFRFTGNELIFLADQSDEFIYVKVADGERFIAAENENW